MNATKHIQTHLKSDEFNTLLFWHGPLSQWWVSDFVIDGMEYNCAEQYMMAMKARLFGDVETAAKIMNLKGPYKNQYDFGQKYAKEQKKLGRLVKNFCPVGWHAVARDVVARANLAKFSQNEELMACLLYTGKYTLVEASPFDQLWGIGLSDQAEEAFNPAEWEGKNWLGQVLTELRDSIII